ncbi:MAG: hypothetical protein JXR52_02310 [Bacteroidales bacterium]|nr:hypothetical protein [Bacteroidales bacterium]MBN2697634.1 hypothetical protein [Bacteroidales bacterium]
MKEKIFALGYMPHRLWGKILYAQILEREEKSLFYSPGEIILKNEVSVTYQRLTPMQKELVHIIDEYNERKLHASFSSRGTVKEFLDGVDEKTIAGHIRPFIERQLVQALRVARENRIKVFVRDKGDRNIFPEDFLVLERNNADPVFEFGYQGNELKYTLHIIHGEKELNLKEHPAEVISNSPACLILGNRIFFINELDGKKLKPFLLKDEVIIPAQHVSKYFSTFVKNTLRDYNTITRGFMVRETVPVKTAFLIFSLGLDQNPVWELRLKYNDFTINPDGNEKRFVEFRENDNTFDFVRYSRDQAWEENLEQILNEAGLRSRDRHFYYLKNRYNQDDLTFLYSNINFLNENSQFLNENGISVYQRLSRNYYLGSIFLEWDSTENQDWFDIYARVRFGTFEYPFIQLRKNILQGNREYVLPDGSIAILPEEWFVTYQPMFQFGKIEDEVLKIHKQHFSMVDESMRIMHKTTISQLEKLTELDRLPEIPLPRGLNAELRSYQSEGFSWLIHLQSHGFGGCLADDMGLGKTLQAIAVLQKNKEEYAAVSHSDHSTIGQLSLFPEEKEKPTALIVVPASLIHNWINECRKFVPAMKVHAYAGNLRNKQIENFRYFDLIVSSYHTVRQDIEILSTFRFSYVILDESQMIKNPNSKLYRAMGELVSDHRLVLTGTPIENSLTDLWSQINFVNEGLLGTLNFFKKQFVQPIEKKKDKEKEERLKEIINPFILRRTKGEVARELPPVLEQIKYCSMTDEQRRLYEEEKSIARNMVLENIEEIGMEKSAFVVLKALAKLRQISNHPLMVDESYEYESGKFNEVLRDVESLVEEKHKVLLFSSFVKHLELFRQKFKDQGLDYAHLTGSMTQKEREHGIRKFQEKDACPVFLISLKAGGIGLNLTSADYVFILDPWWNPAAEMQALNRAHRIGQDKNVFVFRYISNDSIEEKILRLQEKKSELAKTFVASSNPLKYMSKKDVIELFA